MNRIVISEFMDERALTGFPSDFDILYDASLVDRRDDLMDLLGNADALIVRNRTQVNEDLLASAPSLKAIGRLGVGLDNIDLEACQKHHIAVLPATGANSNSVAEYVIGSIMALSRRAYQRPDTLTQMQSGQWPRNTLIGGEISGKTLGLIGFGDIARLVAQKASALGMRIHAYDPYLPETSEAWTFAKRCDLVELLAYADCVSLHVPLNESTYHLIDKQSIATMKDGALLINTSRGGVIDDTALSEALRDEKLAGAALDVFETEPMTADSGILFKDLKNVILTPHIAGITEEGNVRVSHLTVANVLKALRDHS